MEGERLPSEERSLLDSLKDAIVALDEEAAVAAAEKAVATGIDPRIAIRYAVASTAIAVGEKFDEGEYFLPQLVISGDIMDVVTKVLEKNIPSAQRGVPGNPHPRQSGTPRNGTDETGDLNQICIMGGEMRKQTSAQIRSSNQTR
jgi:cobalamin-dependent methionine synthase I